MIQDVQSQSQSWFNKVILFVVIGFPLTIVLVPYAGTSISVIFSLLASIFCIANVKNISVSRDEKLFVVSCLSLMIVALFVSLFSGIDKDVWRTAGRFMFIVFSIPLYFVFRDYLLKTSYIWWSLFLAVVLCGLAAIYEFNFGSIYTSTYHMDRARAAVHPIHFADITLSMLVMLVAALTVIKKWNVRRVLLITLVIVLGITAVIMSMSRGAWIMIPVLSLIIAWQFRRYVSKKWFYSGMLALPLLLLLIYFIPATGVKDRVDTTIHNMQSYTQGQAKGTSIGGRFEMWKASWLLFQQSPVVGVGWGNYRQGAAELNEQGKVGKLAATYTHPHNQYMSALASGGLVMLVALLALFLIQLKLFLKLYADDSNEVKAYGLAGIVLVVGFMGFALSATVFERSIPVSFYAFYVPLLLAVGNRIKSQRLGSG